MFCFMDSLYHFPLFGEILQGALNPQLPSMHADTDYKERIEQQIIVPATDNGRYLIRFWETTHTKQEYYRRLLLSETFGYCHDMTALLAAVTNPQIRSYYRHSLLDQHLSTCMRRLADKMQQEGLNHSQEQLREQHAGMDAYCNEYVFQLLKVCLAKAYLELQHCLTDVVSYHYDEKGIYSTFFNETVPVRSYLQVDVKSRPERVPNERPVSCVAENREGLTPVAEALKAEKYTTAEVAELLRLDERTVRRYLNNGQLKGTRLEQKWLVFQADLEHFIQHKNNSNQSEKKS